MVRKIDSRKHQVDTMSSSKSVNQEQSRYHVNDIEDKQLRFPLALKRARLAKKLKQETMAALLHVKLRTFVSWETGTRVPSAGTVAHLCLLLKDDVRLNDELFTAYVADDLVRQAQLQREEDQARLLSVRAQLTPSETNFQAEKSELPLSLIENKEDITKGQNAINSNVHTISDVSQQSQPDKSSSEERLKQLFTIIETLHAHPELVAVTRDFLNELTLE